MQEGSRSAKMGRRSREINEVQRLVVGRAKTLDGAGETSVANERGREVGICLFVDSVVQRQEGPSKIGASGRKRVTW